MADIRQKIVKWVGKAGKYKYAAFVLIIGILLMCIPLSDHEKKSAKPEVVQMEQRSLEEKLSEILSRIEGAGEVCVLLSPETEACRTYQNDIVTKTTADSMETQQKTVIVSEGQNDVPLEVRVTHPTYRGAVVVCQGADRASVKLSIIWAVSNVTGLGSDRITVIKMKQ